MTTSVGLLSRPSTDLLRDAIHRNRALSLEGALERLFTLAFSKLVYAQIWEDPVVDMEALEMGPHTRLVTIASGGCNVLSYLTADPARIFAVDLNSAHIALNRLKLCAVRKLPDYTAFHHFFGGADDRRNVAAYDRYLRPHLDDATRHYWDRRDLLGRRRIAAFGRGFYRYGLLGRFIGFAHLIARLHGRNPRAMLAAHSSQEQRETFDRVLAPLFERGVVRFILDHRVSLYGLGIPPAQYETLKEGSRMSEVVRSRLERLACDFDIKDNYFAWQAFNRGYSADGAGPLPPYLQPASFETIRVRAGRVGLHQTSFTSFLEQQSPASLDRYVLLDAQDWMSPEMLTRLWSEITRTARPGARVIFRTAAPATLLPGHIPDALLARWHYEEGRSRELARRDRSAIYGGFHLYVLKDGAA
jgi:S-adenosylmethionine-diacylglycerol 3-amino-3-carboxypropyl transferase